LHKLRSTGPDLPGGSPGAKLVWGY